jgi:hypothetical protein
MALKYLYDDQKTEIANLRYHLWAGEMIHSISYENL